MLRVETVPMDLSSVMTRVVNNTRCLRMAEDELRLVNQVPPQILVMGDEVRLEQVFKNLLDNAAKFTDPGGEIRFDRDGDDETVTISVRITAAAFPRAGGRRVRPLLPGGEQLQPAQARPGPGPGDLQEYRRSPWGPHLD